MPQKTAAITWVPLCEAFEHVLKYELDRWVTERLLRRALADGRVRARGYVVSAYGEDLIEPLSRCLFTIFDDEYTAMTAFNVEANSIRHVDGWHCDECRVYRVELAWGDLLQSGRSR